MAIAWYYDPEKNPKDAASLPGVPLRDLTDEEVAGYPTYIQRSIAASPLYRKTNPDPTPRKPAPKKTKPAGKPDAEQPPADEPTAPSDDTPAPEQEG